DLKTEEELQIFEKELVDRFGELPVQAVDLLNSVRVKWIANKLGLERLVMKNGRITGYFLSNQDSGFYQSDIFSKILQYIQIHSDRVSIKEKETRNGLRLLLKIRNITSINE